MMYVTLLLIVAAVSVSAQNYCNVCSDHTMCLYKGKGSNCGRVLSRGVDAASKKTILKVHNYHRQQVALGHVKLGAPGPQPQAANMRKMVWNDEIAAIAQRWADQCDFEHDRCRKVSKYQVGQNLHMSSTTGSAGAPDWSGAIQLFVDEVKLFDRTWVSRFQFSAAIGHYSQVVWADTNTVGCGYSVFKSPEDPKWTRKYYVCNYGPSGNWKDREMYKVGKPCSKCPTKCSNKYPGLCS